MHIDAFWAKSTIRSPLSWENWTTHWKVSFPAKEGIHFENLLIGPHARVDYPPELNYEEAVEVHAQATELDRKARNQQLKVI